MNGWSASSEFNFPDASDAVSTGSAGAGGGAPTALASALGAGTDRFWHHPGFVLGAFVFVTAGLIGWTSKPIARVHVDAAAGPAKGEIGGEI